VRATSKLGRVRVGFHVYNDENDVDLVCDVLGR
jgi:selenocysteine lyase/cysteine desulfurase